MLAARFALGLLVLAPGVLAARQSPAPTNVLVQSTGASVTVSWAPPANLKPFGYRVQRGTDSKMIGADLTPQIDATSFVDATAAAGTTYFYTVIAVFSQGNAQALPVQITTPPSGRSGLRDQPIALAPSAMSPNVEARAKAFREASAPPVASPTSLTATIVGAHAVDLSWPRVQGVSYYRVFGPGLPADGAVTISQPFHVTAVPTGLQVFSISSEYPGVSNRAGLPQAQFTMPPFFDPKAAIVYNGNAGSVVFTFDVATAEPLSYRLWRDNGNGAAQTEITTGTPGTDTPLWVRGPTSQPGITHVQGSMSAQGLYPAVVYNYQIAVVAPSGDLYPSPQLPVSIPQFNLQATNLLAPDRIVLEWSPFGSNLGGIVAYSIQKGRTAPGGVQFDWIRDAANNRLMITGPLKFEDTVVQRGVQYSYRVCASLNWGLACPGVDAMIPLP